MPDPKKILLIDDDPDMHHAVTAILESQGYEVKCCLTGPDGVAAARADTPDLILLDIMLSSPSEGFHLAYDLSKDDELKDVPIIMLSAIGSMMGMDYAQELGSDYIRAEKFLDKPIDAQTLLSAIDEVLNK
ncbi:MAG: response regulator transcription factor [Phycisphaerae bacterium]|nr:response regulator transcription factor [Phycisphaerae bacterium]